MAVGLLVAFVAYGVNAAGVSVQRLPLPDVGVLINPRIARTDDGFLMSWVRTTVEGAHALEFAHYHDGQWDERRSVAQGENWFINPHEKIGVLPLGKDRYLGYWLERNSQHLYDYSIRLRILDGGRASDVFSPHRQSAGRQHGFLAFAQSPGNMLQMIWVEGGQDRYVLMSASI
jgi:hypothetical protein